ncbi:aminotransferase class V-fold PLP-dependent enzyme [Flagellimonas onchidii]|uniref:aminotransferase class V-fold PLP-dependent enzyme n=1 Tax=Flagellimonas onchidii TaxID=2562684 RepID=UPI0010A6B0E8|nr:aminotransferase class V-fold PLP-dependent enzyme [Allomuricauda onchidii]
MKSYEQYFEKIRNNIIGNSSSFQSPYGEQKILYADWIAGGRLYGPIEKKISSFVGPMMANTHSFSSETGKASTYAYQHARKLIKKHVNANEEDVLVTTGTGMTGALARLHRLLGIRCPETLGKKIAVPEKDRPVVFISHKEHHSNQVPWMETIADVVMVPCGDNLLVDPKQLDEVLTAYKDRSLKIGAFTACSNVTGIITPYHQLAKVMHKHGGLCFVDFAASAPYVEIDMHPDDPEEKLDAVMFSPHKFLGGPGSCGVLVFNKSLYKNSCPEVLGGGNVKWTDPWGGYGYHKDVETLEDAGTPGILQTMRAAMAMRLKEEMGIENIENREKELLNLCSERLSKIRGLHILGDLKTPRIGCLSFWVEEVHYNLMVRLLNDKFGIQVRGGWSCASTYGHYLFGIGKERSKRIVKGIQKQDLTNKPGWVRLSLHPSMTNEEALFICNAIEEIVYNAQEWGKDYKYNRKTNEFEHLHYEDDGLIEYVGRWFD